MYIDSHTEALTNNQVIAIGNSDPNDYSRIHCVKKGLVLDRSHLNIHRWYWENGIYLRRDLEDDPEIYPLAIIYPVFNEDELELVKPALRKSGIKLKKLVTVTALMKAIDEAEKIEDDDNMLEEVDDLSDEED